MLQNEKNMSKFDLNCFFNEKVYFETIFYCRSHLCFRAFRPPPPSPRLHPLRQIARPLASYLFCGMAEAYLCPKPESEFGEILSGGKAVQQERIQHSGYYQNVIMRVFGAACGRTPNEVAALVDAAVPTAPPSPTSNAEDTERPLARFDIEGRCVSEARGQSLCVGDCTLKAWFAKWREGNQAGGATRKNNVDGGWTPTCLHDVATRFSRG